MITREEFDRKYFTAKSQSAKNEACLEYINSLEAQLANTEQLPCGGCDWEYGKEGCVIFGCATHYSVTSH